MHTFLNTIYGPVRCNGNSYPSCLHVRSIYLACAVAVGAYRLNRPVRCMLDRNEDMASSGGRHPFMARYRVGATSDGLIKALDIQMYSNAGCSLDLSGAVMDRALFHLDNAYLIPNVRGVGFCCRTNLPTNTAFRGFGGPQVRRDILFLIFYAYLSVHPFLHIYLCILFFIFIRSDVFPLAFAHAKSSLS